MKKIRFKRRFPCLTEDGWAESIFDPGTNYGQRHRGGEKDGSRHEQDRQPEEPQPAESAEQPEPAEWSAERSGKQPEQAAYLLKEPYVQIGEYDESYVEGLLKRLAGLGTKNVVLTGVSFDKSKLGVAIYDGKNIYYDFNDYLPVSMHGTGDVFASAFTGAMVSGKNIQEAAALAADFVVDSIKATESTHKYGVRFEKALHSVK